MIPRRDQLPDYPGQVGRPLRGTDRLRFLLRLWRHGYPTVAAYQRRALYPILVDGKVGAQTWEMFWHENGTV